MIRNVPVVRSCSFSIHRRVVLDYGVNSAAVSVRVVRDFGDKHSLRACSLKGPVDSDPNRMGSGNGEDEAKVQDWTRNVIMRDKKTRVVVSVYHKQHSIDHCECQRSASALYRDEYGAVYWGHGIPNDAVRCGDTGTPLALRRFRVRVVHHIWGTSMIFCSAKCSSLDLDLDQVEAGADSSRRIRRTTYETSQQLRRPVVPEIDRVSNCR